MGGVEARQCFYVVPLPRPSLAVRQLVTVPEKSRAVATYVLGGNGKDEVVLLSIAGMLDAPLCERFRIKDTLAFRIDKDGVVLFERWTEAVNATGAPPLNAILKRFTDMETRRQTLATSP